VKFTFGAGAGGVASAWAPPSGDAESLSSGRLFDLQAGGRCGLYSILHISILHREHPPEHAASPPPPPPHPPGAPSAVARSALFGRKVPYYTAPHTTPHTTLHSNKNREALRQRKLPRNHPALRERGEQPARVQRLEPEPLRRPRDELGLFSYEGARSFVTDICCTGRDSPYKRDMGRHNDKRPSSKPASRRCTRSARPSAPQPASASLRAEAAAASSDSRSTVWIHGTQLSFLVGAAAHKVLSESHKVPSLPTLTHTAPAAASAASAAARAPRLG
jgi:hypothetical protein